MCIQCSINLNLHLPSNNRYTYTVNIPCLFEILCRGYKLCLHFSGVGYIEFYNDNYVSSLW